MKKAAIGLCLAVSSQLASAAVTTDLPGYNPTAIVTSATLNPDATAFSSNFGAPVNAITDASVATAIWTGTGTTGSVDLRFGTTISDGAGADLSLFFIGGGGHSVGMTLWNDALTSGSSLTTYSPSTYTGYNVSQGSKLYPIYYMNIDLADFASFLGTNPVEVIRLDLSNSSAALSLVGTYDPSFAPIPIPAAVWMFGSGLIGLVGVARRRA